jgi:hypothetical protein
MEEEKKEEQKENKDISNTEKVVISPIRTYDIDLQSTVKNQGISSSKIFLAEQEKREKQRQSEDATDIKHKPNIIKIISGLFLVLLGVGALGYASYFYLQNRPAIQIQNDGFEKNIFFDIEEQENVLVDFRSSREIISAIREIIRKPNSLNINDVKQIKIEVTIPNAGENFTDIKREVDSAEFLNYIESRVSDSFVRSLKPEMIIGLHKTTQNEDELFILFKIDDFELALGRAREWEPFMISDLQNLFFKTLGSSQLFTPQELEEVSLIETINEDRVDNLEETEISESETQGEQDETNNIKVEQTETNQMETEPAPARTESNYNQRDFKDIVLSNKNTRAIVNSDNQILFFYSFIDRENLIMTTNKETFDSIIRKINNRKIVQ